MRTIRTVAIGALLAIAACSDKAKQQAAADSDLARDLALAGAQTMQPQPTFQDTSVAPAPEQAGRAKNAPPAPTRTHASTKPVVHTPKPVPQSPPPQPVQTQAQAPTPAPIAPAPTPAPAAAPAHAEIGAGTGFALSSGSKVCTTNEVGDKLVATLNSAVTGTNGAIIPAGSSVVLEVASIDANNNPPITFRVRSVVVGDKTYNVAADVTSLGQMQRTEVANSDPNADKKKVIGGAIAGALLGQFIGHSTKGTIIGAAAGAATGAAAAKMSQKYESCLPAGAPMRLTLNQPIVMS